MSDPVVVPFTEKATCKTCRHWFVYGTDVDALREMIMNGSAFCNHPSVGGQGHNPVKRGADSCNKYEYGEVGFGGEIARAALGQLGSGT